ncbi:hypothetical protein Q5752_000824 [Cryptotrichosporon argae]
MPPPVSQSSIIQLNAVTAELETEIANDGARHARRGTKQRRLDKHKTPFDKQSPGLLNRLAAEARNDAKKRHFANDSDMSEQQRCEVLEAKARRYDALSRGDFSGMTEKDLAEATIDFERKADEWSDYSSDVDGSAAPALKAGEDDLDQVEYVDELGRTRVGTRKDARDAEREAGRDRRLRSPASNENAASSSYAQVRQSNVIFRNRGAGAYQFSLDEDVRAQEQTALKETRLETEAARANADTLGASKARLSWKRKIDDRKALLERKRRSLLGDQVVDTAKQRKQEKVADRFLQGLDDEFRRE